MDLRLLARVLLERRRLRARERWSRAQLAAHQARALAALRAHALAHSPFYRRFHRGLEGRPLAELPVLTKAELMTHFDALVTDRGVRLADAQAHLAALQGDALYAGRCGCDLPFALLERVEGRAEDALTLPAAAGGTVRVHPNLFHAALEALPVRAWQVVQEEGGLRVLLVEAAPAVHEAQVAASLAAALALAGVSPAVQVRAERAADVQRTALGKAPLVRALAPS